MHRSLYTELKHWKNGKERKPLVLGGARQTGKTWILQHFGSQEFRSTLYVNFESDPKASTIFEDELSPGSIVPSLELYAGKRVDAETDLIVFDEIQLSPRALTSLKYFSEGETRYAVCAAGSLLGLSGSTSAYPVGKVTQRTLFPLSFREFLAAAEPRLHEYLLGWATAPSKIPEFVHVKLLEHLFRFFLVGGMPEAVRNVVESDALDDSTIRAVRAVHNDLLIGYRSDFAKHSGRLNSLHLSRVLESIPAQLSREVEGNAGRYVFKGVLPHSRRYRDVAGAIDWLTTTGLVHRVPVIQEARSPLAAHVRESIFKLYLLDIGLLHSMLAVPPFDVVNQSWGAYRGYVAENFVATELRAHGHDSLYAWKGSSAEIEFVLEIDGNVVPIEVKAGANTRRAKSLTVFRDTYHPPVAVKVSTRNYTYDGEVVHIPLYAAGFVADIVRAL